MFDYMILDILQKLSNCKPIKEQKINATGKYLELTSKLDEKLQNPLVIMIAFVKVYLDNENDYAAEINKNTANFELLCSAIKNTLLFIKAITPYSSIAVAASATGGAFYNSNNYNNTNTSKFQKHKFLMDDMNNINKKNKKNKKKDNNKTQRNRKSLKRLSSKKQNKNKIFQRHTKKIL